jgi:hypothetical protein
VAYRCSANCHPHSCAGAVRHAAAADAAVSVGGPAARPTTDGVATVSTDAGPDAVSPDGPSPGLPKRLRPLRLSDAVLLMNAEEQLVVDLTKRISARLCRWVDDSRDLFEMAEVDEQVADQAIFVGLVMMVQHIACSSSNVDLEEILDIVREQHARS